MHVVLAIDEVQLLEYDAAAAGRHGMARLLVGELAGGFKCCVRDAGSGCTAAIGMSPGISPASDAFAADTLTSEHMYLLFRSSRA